MPRLLEEIKKLSDKQIHAKDDWAIAIVAGNTYGHFAEHHVELHAAVPKKPAEIIEKIREGWRPDSDWLPERLLRENLPTGMARGVGLSPDELEEMIGGYYQAREWDENGFVPERKLEQLEIATS